MTIETEQRELPRQKCQIDKEKQVDLPNIVSSGETGGVNGAVAMAKCNWFSQDPERCFGTASTENIMRS
jgi:hypothetical protein